MEEVRFPRTPQYKLHSPALTELQREELGRFSPLGNANGITQGTLQPSQRIKPLWGSQILCSETLATEAPSFSCEVPSLSCLEAVMSAREMLSGWRDGHKSWLRGPEKLLLAGFHRKGPRAMLCGECARHNYRDHLGSAGGWQGWRPC